MTLTNRFGLFEMSSRSPPPRFAPSRFDRYKRDRSGCWAKVEGEEEDEQDKLRRILSESSRQDDSGNEDEEDQDQSGVAV